MVTQKKDMNNSPELDLIVRDPVADVVALATLVTSGCGCLNKRTKYALSGRLVAPGQPIILLEMPIPDDLDNKAVDQTSIGRDLLTFKPVSIGTWELTLRRVEVPGGHGVTYVGVLKDHATGKVLEVTAADEPLTIGTILVIGGIILLACLLLKGIDYLISESCQEMLAQVQATCRTPPCSIVITMEESTGWNWSCDYDVNCKVECKCPPGSPAGGGGTTTTTTTTTKPDGTVVTTTQTETTPPSSPDSPFGFGSDSEIAHLSLAVVQGEVVCDQPFSVRGKATGPTRSAAAGRAQSRALTEARLACPSDCPNVEELMWDVAHCTRINDDLWECSGVGDYKCT